MRDVFLKTLLVVKKEIVIMKIGKIVMEGRTEYAKFIAIIIGRVYEKAA